MKVKLRRGWFAPDKTRFRAFMYDGVVTVPDHFINMLPSDAEVVEPPVGWVEGEDGVWVKSDAEADDEKPEDDDEPEAEKTPETFSEMAQRDAKATDPKTAFQKQLEAEANKSKVKPIGARGTDPKPKPRRPVKK